MREPRALTQEPLAGVRLQMDSDAEIGRDDAAAWLTIRHADRVFMYRLGARSRARPAIQALANRARPSPSG